MMAFAFGNALGQASRMRTTSAARFASGLPAWLLHPIEIHEMVRSRSKRLKAATQLTPK